MPLPDNLQLDPISERIARMQYFFDHSHEALIFHRNGIITDTNPALTRISGFTSDEIIGSHVLKWISPHYHDLVKENLKKNTEDMYEISLIHKSGSEIPVYLRPINTLVEGKKERLVVIQDIRDLKESQNIQHETKKQIHALSNFDSHTGIPNRHLFNHCVSLMLENHQEEEQRFAIVHITIEHMNIFNEVFNRHVVDLLLKQWVTRLCDMLDATIKHHTARIGGIRFAIALPYIENSNAVVHLLQKLRQKLEAPYQIGQHKIDSLIGSYGISFYPEDSADIETLMNQSEIACRNARESETDNICCFSNKMNIHTLEKFEFEMRLKGALDRGEMTLYYQPKVDTFTEEVIGYEALIRWIDPEKGLIPPLDFIPLAEENRLIIPIGEWVIWSACKQLAQLQDLPGSTPKISINLSSLQFKQANLVEVVHQALMLFEIKPGLLDLELTESVVMDDVKSSVDTLNRLKELGVSISIDDFGTGYSSLSYLKRFPIDTLKVDRSFITELTKSSQDKSIARTIIALAKSLNLETVAEGVETPEQLSILREMNCDLIQGYLFGKPLPAKEVFS